MARRKRETKKLILEKLKKSNKRVLVISIFLMIFSIGLIYSNYSLFKRDKMLIKKDKELENEVLNNNQDINQELAKLRNIDELIKEEKKNYFINIKALEDRILSGESKTKIAYLTFDDGPYYTTYKFLDVLDKKNVKATFFTIGADKVNCYDNRNKKCHPLYSEEVKRGHTIANHTYSHAIWHGLYSSADSFIAQIKKQEKLIQDETGVTTNIMRFPGGSGTAGGKKQAIIKKLRANGYGWVDWTAQDGDGGNLKNKQQAWKNFTGTINSKIEVVLFHDYSQITLSILPDAIDYLRKNGYELFPLFYESNMVNK